MQMMKKPGSTPALKLFKPKESELRKQHREMSQSQNQSSEQDQENEEDQTSAICCCGAPGCRIGPFVPDNRPKF